MKKYLKNTILLIEKEIKEYFPEEVDNSWINLKIGKVIYPFDTRVWKDICSELFYDLFNRGGKRIRPVLTCLTHRALKGDNPRIYKFAVIPEIIHSGTVIIDDIEDKSNFRRGKETIHKLYGIDLAINNGNFNYFFPQLIIKDSNLNDSQKVELYNIIVEEMVKIHIGQGMDILWSQEGMYDVSLNDYLQMCAYKTGALLSVAVKIGGILANADSKKLNKLGNVATSIGIAFQIQDDILNLKPSKEWGKESGEDISEGKLTYMVADTISRADEEDKCKLISILKSKTKDKAKINEAIGIMDKYSAFTRAHNFSKELILDAKQKVEEIFEDSDYRKIYLEILDFIINRKK